MDGLLFLQCASHKRVDLFLIHASNGGLVRQFSLLVNNQTLTLTSPNRRNPFLEISERLSNRKSSSGFERRARSASVRHNIDTVGDRCQP